MSDKQKNKLIPKLRFPEFKDNGEWEGKKLGEICNITNGKANAQDHINEGKYPLFDRSEVIKASNEYIFDCEAVIIPGEGVRFTPKYYKGKFNLHQRAYALKDFKCNGKFIFHLMTQRSNLLAKSAVKSTVLSLRLPILQNFPIVIPEKIQEQQKIASFLSNLDKLIEAHKKKLDLLKRHKKGLMQNLFPQEGEKVPKLRFPEFKNSGEWEEKKLNELANRIVKKNKKGFKKTVFTNSATDGIVEQRNFFDKDIANKSNLENYYIVQPGDYIYNPRISNYAPVGPLFKNNTNKTGVMSPLYTVFRFKNKNNDFYQYYFLSNHWFSSIRKVANTGARFDRMSITSSDFMTIRVLSPLVEEQQKIASILSSLDELIKAEEKKIELLEKHKKGLMQGLFPNIDE